MSGHRTQLGFSDLLGTAPWRAWLRLLAIALLVKALIVAVVLLELGATPEPIAALAAAGFHWDGGHYLTLATHGYGDTGDLRNLIAFFPLYPALIAALGAAGIPLPVGALLINNVGALAATLLLFEIGRQDGDARAGWWAALLWSVFPTAYFLLNGYSEGLFAMLAFGSVLAARRRCWAAAGMLGGLAAATRLTGLALFPMLVVELWAGRQGLVRVWRAGLSPALVPLGFLTYLGVNGLVLKDPLAFVEVQRVHWYHWLSPPWVGFLEAVRGLFWRTPWERLTVGAGELVGGVSAYAVTALAGLKLRRGDAVYAAALAILFTFLPFWLSIPRYLLTMYPLFLLAGRLRNRVVLTAAAGLSIAGLLAFSVAFARGSWAF